VKESNFGFKFQLFLPLLGPPQKKLIILIILIIFVLKKASFIEILLYYYNISEVSKVSCKASVEVGNLKSSQGSG
jgi:hypothetical protein